MKKLISIFVIVSLALLIVPASAYTTLNTLTGEDTKSGYAQWSSHKIKFNQSGVNSISKLEWTGSCVFSPNETGSVNTRVYTDSGYTSYGYNVTLDWSGSDAYDGSVCTLSLTMIDKLPVINPADNYRFYYLSKRGDINANYYFNNTGKTSVADINSMSTDARYAGWFGAQSAGYVPSGISTSYGGVDDAPVTFHVSEVGNFTHKLSDVNIAVSSGQSGVTDSNGTVTISIMPPASTYTYGATKSGYGDISGWVLGSLGTTGGDEYFTMEPSTRIGNITLYAVTKDAANPSSTITGTTISIKNQTGGWYNATYASGNAVITGTDALMANDLSVGQTVTICGSGSGYADSCSNVTIPYDRYLHRIYLTQTTQQPTNGNWNLLVTVIRNLDGNPVCSALVTVTTGVSGAGIFEEGTECTTGTASFLNISASTSAMINVVAQGYQSGSAYTPVVPNSTQHVTIELVQIGQTPIATPVSPTATRTLSGSDDPQPVITDANGNPITTSQGKAEWGFDQLFAIIPQIALIIVSLIFAWIFWRGLDIVTNGMASLIIRKVIEGVLKDMFR